MDESLRSLRSVATRAARAGGECALAAFRDGHVPGEYGPGDVKAEVDAESDRRIVAEIRDAYPDHAIRTEESSHDGEPDDYEWVVDPLDGTNNLTVGYPVFATAVAVLDDRGPLVSVVYEPLVGDCYAAVRDRGATVNDRPLAAESEVALDSGTVSFVRGGPAIRTGDPRRAAGRMRDAIEGKVKRVLASWAPCVDWGLLARGGIEAVVAYHADEWERHAGRLLAREAGAVSWASDAGALTVDAVDVTALDRIRGLVEPHAVE